MNIVNITYIWILIALIVLPINLIYKAPYGKHSTRKWGKVIDNKTTNADHMISKFSKNEDLSELYDK